MILIHVVLMENARFQINVNVKKDILVQNARNSVVKAMSLFQTKRAMAMVSVLISIRVYVPMETLGNIAKNFCVETSVLRTDMFALNLEIVKDMTNVYAMMEPMEILSVLFIGNFIAVCPFRRASDVVFDIMWFLDGFADY